MTVHDDRRRTIIALELALINPAASQTDPVAVARELERLRRLERWQTVNERGRI